MISGNRKEDYPQHIYIIGAKSLGQYGGFETFVDKLTEYHQSKNHLQYHVACKANGPGHMDESKLQDPVERIDKNRFLYHNAECFKIKVPQIGAAQAIVYDMKAMHYCLNHIKMNRIQNPVIYVLACRIGPLIRRYKEQIKKYSGRLYVNPDGHEWKRTKWSKPVRAYWKWSERQMVRYSDLVVCDSRHIERYIKKEYRQFSPKTTYIAYGTDVTGSALSDDDPAWCGWLTKHHVKPGAYYLIVGRFVPENHFETMIAEFMKTKTKRDLVIVTTPNERYYKQLENRLHFRNDSRIKFVGTVYDRDLLKKIREKAYAYIHGHSVGGTNPSLLEALASTKLNLLLNVGFNREVGGDAALYWN